MDNKENKTCSCGTTLRSFLDTGLFGCEKCYQVFESELIPILKRIQNTTTQYDSDASEQEKREREQKNRQKEADDPITQLRLRYREYISAGNYEDAEQIAFLIKKHRGEKV